MRRIKRAAVCLVTTISITFALTKILHQSDKQICLVREIKLMNNQIYRNNSEINTRPFEVDIIRIRNGNSFLKIFISLIGPVINFEISC